MENKEMSMHRIAYLRKIRKHKTLVRMIQILILVVFIVFWELSYRMGFTDGFITGSPSRVIKTFITLAHTGELWKHIGTSCIETIIGFVLGTVIGTIISAFMWYYETLAKVLDPFLVVLNALPKTALGPIFIVWIGANVESIIIMTLAISLIVTIMDMYQGFCQTSPQKIKLLKSFGANRMQLLYYLVLPGNYGTFLNTMKVNVGLSWVGVIMGEFLVSKAGLGYLIVYGSQVFNMDLVLASIIVLAACAGLMYSIVICFEKLISRKLRIR